MIFRKEAFRWLLLVIVAIAIVDCQLYLIAARDREDALERAETMLRVGADVVLGRTEQTLDTYVQILSGIGEVLSIRGNRNGGGDADVHRLLARHRQATSGLRWLLTLRENGHLAAYSTAFPAPDLDLSDRTYYRMQVDAGSKGFYLGPPLLAKTDNALFIPLSRRVVDESGRFTGIVAAGIDPDELGHLLSDQSLPAGYTLRLLLDSGRPLACLPSNDNCLAQDWLHSPLFENLLVRSPHGQFRHDQLYDEAPGPGAYARSARYPIVVAAAVNEAEVLGPWRQALKGYVAVALGSNLALVGIAFFAYRQFQRRRQALAELAEANLRLEERVATRTEQLRLSEARARTFLNTAMDAVVVIDGDSRIVEFNQAAERMFGYSTAEVLGEDVKLLMPADQGNVHNAHVQAANDNAAARIMGRGREVLGRHKDGRQFPVEVSLGTTGEGDMRIHVGIIRDIGARQMMEQQLLRLATTDGLTGLLNRRAFNEEAERLVTIARRYKRPLSLMILDADKFKNINDTHGHAAGDAVLKVLAETMDSTLRGTDLISRLGGEEFGIVLPETTVEGATELGERLLVAIRHCRIVQGNAEIAFTASIGLAWLDPDGDDDLEATLKRADDALYRAKDGGRDRLALQHG